MCSVCSSWMRWLAGHTYRSESPDLHALKMATAEFREGLVEALFSGGWGGKKNIYIQFFAWILFVFKVTQKTLGKLKAIYPWDFVVMIWRCHSLHYSLEKPWLGQWPLRKWSNSVLRVSVPSSPACPDTERLFPKVPRRFAFDLPISPYCPSPHTFSPESQSRHPKSEQLQLTGFPPDCCIDNF